MELILVLLLKFCFERLNSLKKLAEQKDYTDSNGNIFTLEISIYKTVRQSI